MKKLITIAFAVAVVIALFGAYHHLRAQANERLDSPFKGSRVAVPMAIQKHVLSRTYIDQAAESVTLSAGFTPIDSPVTINCLSSGGCTVGAESWTEVGGQTASGDSWGICTELDGTITGICTYQGPVPSNGSYVTGSLNNALALSHGTHTVQAVVYDASGGAILAQYNNTYHVYTP